MAIVVSHSKVLLIPDGIDETVVRPSDWNDEHVVTGEIGPDVDVGAFSVLSSDTFPISLYSHRLGLTTNQRITVGVAIDGWQLTNVANGISDEYVADIVADEDGDISWLEGIVPSPVRHSFSMLWTTSLAIVDGSLVCRCVANLGDVASYWNVRIWLREVLSTPISGGVAPGSLDEGDLPGFKTLNSTITCVSSIVSDLTEDLVLAGTVDCISTVVGGFAGIQSLASSIDGTTSVGGDVTVTSSGGTDYFIDTFDRADGAVGTNWSGYGVTAGTADISSNALRRTDTGGYAQFGTNATAGTFPADYYVTWTLPEATVAGSYYGIIGRYKTGGAGTSGGGVQVLFTGSRTSMNISFGIIGSGTMNGYTDNGNAITTVTGGYPSTWSENRDHTIGLRFSGTTVTIYLDGQEYGYLTANIYNETGTFCCVSGEGNNKRYLNMKVTNYLPTFS